MSSACGGLITVVIASAAKQSTLSFLSPLWIASRSLSSGARSRDPLARNDVDGFLTVPGISHDDRRACDKSTRRAKFRFRRRAKHF
jgi:hypothetical protein